MTQLTIKIEGAEIVRKGLEDLAAEVPKVSRQRIYNFMRKVQARMRKPGKAIRYPVKWDSEKQRRAFFASNGFGRGIPARRTGKYNQAWAIQRLGETGYRLTNPTKYSQYVGGTAYGTSQSRIHGGRWPVMRDVFDDQFEKLPQEIQDALVAVARRNKLT